MQKENLSISIFLIASVFLGLSVLTVLIHIQNKISAQTLLSTTNESYQFRKSWGSNGTDNGQFDSPFGITVDSKGNVYVVDTNNNRTQKFDSNGNFITKWSPKDTGDGQYNEPINIAVDSSDNVYVVCYDNNIQKFDSNGNFITKWSPSGTGISISSKGNVYVTDSGKQVTEFAPYPLSNNHAKNIKPSLYVIHKGISDQF